MYNLFYINTWSCKLTIIFTTSSIFTLSGKNGKSLWGSSNFSKYWSSTSWKYASSLSWLQFFIKSLQNWDVFLTYLISAKGHFWDIAYPHKLFKSQYFMYDDFLFLS